MKDSDQGAVEGKDEEAVEASDQADTPTSDEAPTDEQSEVDRKDEDTEDTEDKPDSVSSSELSDEETEKSDPEESDKGEPEESKPRSPIFARIRRVVFFTAKSAAILLTLAALLGAGGVVGIGWFYYDATSGYDLSIIDDLEIGALVVDARGERIGRIGSFDRHLIAAEELPDHFVEALIAAEDQRFFLHMGFDVIGMTRAMLTNYRAGTIREGASTLTQQLARNIFPLSGKNMDRKLLEIALAARIERQYSKEQILEHYLNRVYFGSGSYGVGSAAQAFFGKPVSGLTLGESAMICGVIRSPSRFSPLADPEAALAARDRTLTRMAQMGLLEPEELAVEIGTPTLVAKAVRDEIMREQRRYLLGRIEKETRQILGDRTLEGLTVQTSIDFNLQLAAAHDVAGELSRVEKELGLSGKEEGALQGAMLMVDNESGEVVVSVGSRDFSASEFDRAWDLKRPTGSAFFPLVYSAAFDSGKFGPESILLDAPVDNREVMLGGLDGVLGEWSTEDEANRWEGRISAAHAFRRSKNSPTVRLGFHTGTDTVLATAAALGVESSLRPYPGTFLGASEMGLSEITRAYTAFPNRGAVAAAPTVVRAISTDDGRAVYSRSERNEAENTPQAISRETADLIDNLMRLEGSEPGSRVAGKAGTTSDYTDAWFVGYTDHYTWGVWVGTDEFETIADKAFGGDIARPLWETMVPRVLVSENDEPGLTEKAAGEEQPAPLRPVARPLSVTDIAAEATEESALVADSGSSPSSEESADQATKPKVAPLIGPDPYNSLGEQ
ncbi:MAG: transglycosylase domain-containing protein [Verrucomicrobiota bacterium]